MNLNQEEKDYINLLQTGQAITTIKGRITSPTLVQVPKINIKKGKITNQNLSNNINV